jgi:hypothetical protein
MANSTSPRLMAGSHRACCSGVPERMIVGHRGRRHVDGGRPGVGQLVHQLEVVDQGPTETTVLLGPHEAQPAPVEQPAAEVPDDVAAPLASPAAHRLALGRAELIVEEAAHLLDPRPLPLGEAEVHRRLRRCRCRRRV